MRAPGASIRAEPNMHDAHPLQSDRDYRDLPAGACDLWFGDEPQIDEPVHHQLFNEVKD